MRPPKCPQGLQSVNRMVKLEWDFGSALGLVWCYLALPCFPQQYSTLAVAGHAFAQVFHITRGGGIRVGG